MRKYTDEQIQEAKNLRNTFNYSFQYLQELTGIPATTMKNWCKNEPIISKSTSFLKNNERRRRIIKTSELSALSAIEHIDTQTAKILVSILYWCEGAKYPSSNALIFANSDMILLETT